MTYTQQLPDSQIILLAKGNYPATHMYVLSNRSILINHAYLFTSYYYEKSESRHNKDV